MTNLAFKMKCTRRSSRKQSVNTMDRLHQYSVFEGSQAMRRGGVRLLDSTKEWRICFVDTDGGQEETKSGNVKSILFLGK